MAKASEFVIDLRYVIKIPEEVFCFLRYSRLKFLGQILDIATEYLSSAVNLLTMSPKISNLNKADFLHFNLFPIHGAIGY